MTINKAVDGSALTISLSGRLDTTTAPELEEELKSAQDELDSLLYFPGVEEDKLPVIEDDEEINLGNVQNDYKEIPEGFQKVISVESTDSLQQENDEQKVYSRVA